MKTRAALAACSLGAGLLLFPWNGRAQADPTASPQPAVEVAPRPVRTNLIEAADAATDISQMPAPRPPALESPPPVQLVPKRYGGMLGQALESKEPWQLFNPLAPPEYGDGTQNLSLNPVTGRAEGLTLFSLRLEPKPRVREKAPRKRRGI